MLYCRDMNSDTSTQDTSSSKQENFFIEIIKFALLAALIVIPFRMFIAEPYIVQGESMSPTFETGNYLIIDKFSHRFNTVERGSTIVFKYPNDPSRFFVKRVVGLPGETVKVENRNVSIKEVGSDVFIQLEETYLRVETNGAVEQELTDTQYFVMGDNRVNSSDSRFWGPLEAELIKGRTLLRLYPFDKIDVFPGSENPFPLQEEQTTN